MEMYIPIDKLDFTVLCWQNLLRNAINKTNVL